MTEADKIELRCKAAVIYYNNACVSIMRRDRQPLPLVLDDILKPLFVEQCLRKTWAPRPNAPGYEWILNWPVKDQMLFVVRGVAACYFIREMER